MLKGNEKASKKNMEMVEKAIKKATGRDDYETVYGYQTKNYLIFSVIEHFALGFNDEEIVAVKIDKEGHIDDASHVYKRKDNCKVGVTGAVVLDNNSRKIKIEVPGIVPSIPGTKQLSVNQVEKQSKFVQHVKSFK